MLKFAAGHLNFNEPFYTRVHALFARVKVTHVCHAFLIVMMLRAFVVNSIEVFQSVLKLKLVGQLSRPKEKLFSNQIEFVLTRRLTRILIGVNVNVPRVGRTKYTSRSSTFRIYIIDWLSGLVLCTCLRVVELQIKLSHFGLIEETSFCTFYGG